MHPITVIEIVTSVGFVLVIFVIVLVSPTRIRKLGLIVASILTLLLLLSFAIRPVWIEFQVSKKQNNLINIWRKNTLIKSGRLAGQKADNIILII